MNYAEYKTMRQKLDKRYAEDKKALERVYVFDGEAETQIEREEPRKPINAKKTYQHSPGWVPKADRERRAKKSSYMKEYWAKRKAAKPTTETNNQPEEAAIGGQSE